MTKAFDKILRGLNETRAHAQGKPVRGLTTHKRQLRRNEVAAVRLQAGMT